MSSLRDPSASARPAAGSSRLIGRSGELTRLRALTGPGGESALVVLGEAGIGKSALLADLTGYGGARGMRVLSAVGSEQESALPRAGLQQLLRPVLDELAAPPQELRAALGLAPARAGPDLLRTGNALVELLARQADGVLVVVDDAHWMDSASLQLLAFAGRRLTAGPITMAYAATGDRPPAALGLGLPELRLGPLSDTEAAMLLQVQPDPVEGSVRAQMLTEASGNPQALIELSRAGPGGPATGSGLGPLPAAGPLSARFAAQLGQLPSVTRHALLLVAVAGDADRDVLASVTGGLTPEALAPAEERGLITVNTTGIRFRHPLLRPAVYYDASFARRAAIHRQLADALGWACLDAGRWDEALELAAEAGRLAGTGITSSTATLITATIEAARGDTEHARALVADALAADVEPGRLVTARARHALGLGALAEGDYLTAFGQLGELFDDDGLPCHPHASYLAVGDLALAAARCGHRLDGRKILKRISAALAEAGQPGSPRRRQLMARADGILADPATPGAYPAGVRNDRTGHQWPFECAQLDLESGEWLRRRRRINEAKAVLGAALEVFRALQARPWQRRAESELRACGIALPGAVASASGLNGLTPQQRQIIRLAAEGLSNREIARRLYLSPRTVASHLYRSFPKLGVAGRHQLHGLIPAADRAAEIGTTAR